MGNAEYMGSIIPFPKTKVHISIVHNLVLNLSQNQTKLEMLHLLSLFVLPYLLPTAEAKGAFLYFCLGKVAPDGTWPCPASPSSSPCAASYQPYPAAVREMSRMRKRSFEQKLFEWQN